MATNTKNMQNYTVYVYVVWLTNGMHGEMLWLTNGMVDRWYGLQMVWLTNGMR